jgi:hypothetical protein
MSSADRKAANAIGLPSVLQTGPGRATRSALIGTTAAVEDLDVVGPLNERL